MIRSLTVLPKSWSIPRICKQFDVTIYKARLAKKIVKDKGVMSSPNSKAATQLSGDTVIVVKTFYYQPGKKDFLSVRNMEGEKEHKQKRLVLCNLKEAYHQFKQQHPGIKVGFSKFAELQPKECALTQKMCLGRSHRYSFSMCVYNSSECQADDGR